MLNKAQRSEVWNTTTDVCKQTWKEHLGYDTFVMLAMNRENKKTSGACEGYADGQIYLIMDYINVLLEDLPIGPRKAAIGILSSFILSKLTELENANNKNIQTNARQP